MVGIGQILNDTYQITERLGSGGGGIIYKAYHMRMQKYVAVKLIKDDIKGDINSRSEVDMLKNFKNDHLPQVLDFVEDGNDVYTVMEFIEGKNFKQLIEGGRTFEERAVRKYAIQLCKAAEYLHSRRPPVIHSDIKPANVILTPLDNICLIDFNISMVSENGIAFSMGGSKNFAAPEQFRRIINAPASVDEFHEETRFLSSDETEVILESEMRQTSNMKTKNTARAYIDTRTDIYGIGATLYYMLTARVPVNGRTDFRGIPCSAYMKDIIAKAMNPNPDKRFQSASEMHKALIEKSYKKRKIIKFAAAMLTAVVLCIGGFLGVNKFGDYLESNQSADEKFDIPAISNTPDAAKKKTANENTANADKVKIPLLVGADIDEATKTLKNIGLSYKITYSDKQYTDIGENCVYSQSLTWGTLVTKDKAIELGVSTYKTETEANTPKEDKIKIPKLIGMDIDEAVKILNDIGLSYKITYSDKQYTDIGANCVYSQSLTWGTLVTKDKTIELGVSTYKGETISPAT